MTRKPRASKHTPPTVSELLVKAFRPVLRAASDLPGVEEGTSYGTPALRIRGKFFVRLREDGDSLVLRTDFDSRDAMLKAQPRLFYITDHYRDYPAVLVRLSVVTLPQLRELLADSWHQVAPKTLVAKHTAPPERPDGRLRGKR